MKVMDLAEHYRQLLHYDEWANREVLEAIRKTGKPLPRAVQLLAHVISAEYVWLTRLTATKQPFPVWPEFTLEQCADQISEIAGAMLCQVMRVSGMCVISVCLNRLEVSLYNGILLATA